MNRLVFGYDDTIAEWVAKRLPNIKTKERFGAFTAIGVSDPQGKPIAAVVYNGFRSAENPIEVAATVCAVSPEWCQRGTIHALLHYPFEQLKVVRVSVHIAKKNKRARRLARGLGFIEEGVLKYAFDGKTDQVIYGLTKENWLKGKYGPRLEVKA